MKTERFEDIIRKKLESIEPDYQESDWINFKAFSDAANSTLFNRFFNNSIFKAAATVAVTSILAFAGHNYFENKILSEKVNELTKKVEVLQAKNFYNSEKENRKSIDNESVTNNSKNENSISTLDKGILNSNLEDKNSIGNEQFSNPELSLGNKIATSEIEKLNAFNRTFTSNGASKFYKTTKKGKRYQLGMSKISEINAENNLDYSVLQKSGNYYKKIRWATNQPAEEKKDNLNENDNTIGSTTDLINISESKINYNALSIRGLKVDSTKKLAKAFNKKDFAYFVLEEKSKKLSFSLADAYLRTGLSATAGRGQIGYGITTELFLDQRISISVGIKGTSHFPEAFENDNNYRNVTHRDFREKYRLNVPPTKEILNINQKKDILSIPVRFNYYQPLTNNLNLIATTGSDIDLNGMNTTSYDFKGGFPLVFANPNQNFEKGTGKSKIDTKKFNNVYLAVGAEKRFGKLAIQAKVYDNFLVKNINYRKKNSFGVEFGVFYKL